MRFQEFGTPGAETIVFLHGGNVAGWMWGMQVPAFEDYRVLVPDLPGFGASNDEPWISIAASADAVAAIIPDGAHVVGLSLGSSVAVQLALGHPELVRSLFLASAQVLRPSLPLRVVGRAMIAFWERPGFWTSLGRSYGLTGDDATLFIETGLGIRRETALAIFAEVSRGMPDTTFTAPTLAIAGERDRGSVTSLAALPRARTAVAPGVGHQWNFEAPELFNAALREWIEHRGITAGLRAVTGPE